MNKDDGPTNLINTSPISCKIIDRGHTNGDVLFIVVNFHLLQ